MAYVLLNRYADCEPVTAFDAAQVKVNRSYEIETENHHSMEPHSTIAAWKGEKLIVYDADGSRQTPYYRAD